MNKIILGLKTICLQIFNKSKIDHNTWVFTSSFGTKFNYNSKPFFEYVMKEHPEIKPLFIINDIKLIETLGNEYGYEYFVSTLSNQGLRKVLCSGVWITSAGLPVYGFGLNKNRVIVNLWHGVPLKKICLMEEKKTKVSKILFRYLVSPNYSVIATTSAKLIEIMASSFGVNSNVVRVIGQPRNDVLFNEVNKEEFLSETYSELPRYGKLILYAPTYREYGNTSLFPFDDFNLKKLGKYLEQNEYIIFIRLHQSELSSVEILESDRIRFINSDRVPEIMDIMSIFDLLITDYSSIYIDYLITEKPVMFLPYDYDKYMKNRGMNFHYNEVTPGPKPSSFSKFMIEIDRLLNDQDYYRNEREECNKLFNEIKLQSSELVFEEIKKELMKLK